MIRRDFAYFLNVSNVSPSEAEKLSELLKREEFFNGILRTYDTPGSGPIVFDTDTVGGSITAIDRDQVEEMLHKLAMVFPEAEFYLKAEDVDDKSSAYEIKMKGDLFQSAYQRSYMPELSPPVPFECRHDPFPTRDFVNEILTGTDFQLLHKQKYDLVNCVYHGVPVPSETTEGLINFLDIIEDWGEQEGRFVFPELQEPVKPSLSTQIAAATAVSEASNSDKTAPNITPTHSNER